MTTAIDIDGKRYKARLIDAGKDKWRVNFMRQGVRYQRTFYGIDSFRSVVLNLLEGKNKMPKKKKGKKKFKSKYKRNASPTVSKEKSLISADRTLVKMNYKLRIAYDGEASQFGSSVQIARNGFVANSCFDPGGALDSGQPVGFDQWATYYNTYLVYGCGIKATWTSTITTADQGNIDMGILPINESDDTDSISIRNFELYPAGKVLVTNNAYQAAGRRNQLKSYMSTAKMAGVDRATVTARDDFSSAVTTSPANNWNWVVGLETMDGSTLLEGYLDVKLSFYTCFYDREFFVDSVALCNRMISMGLHDPETVKARRSNKCISYHVDEDGEPITKVIN